jgi:hypothetical protein
MGDEFIQKKNQSFKHQTDEAHEKEFGSVSLFDDNPEVAVRLVRFRCPEANPAIGALIYFTNVPGKDKVRVMQGNAPIGEADAAGSKEVRSILAEHPDLNGVLPAKVAISKDLAGYCKAQLGVK